MNDVLAALVTCEVYREAFPQGMPRRGCLRRQLEQRRAGKEWEPVKPFCASSCPVGRVVRAEVARAGLELGACVACGAATIGEPCTACVEKRKERAVPARSPERAPPQERIWAKDAPDAPIAPMPRHDVGLTVEQVAEAVEHVREAVRHPRRAATARRAPPRVEVERHAEAPRPHPPAPLAPANPEPPVQPAEEEHVPTRKMREPKKCCGSKGSRHMSGCAEDGKRPPRPARVPRPAPAASSAYVVPIDQLSDEDLAQSIAQARAEIVRRREAAEGRAKRLAEIERSISEAA